MGCDFTEVMQARRGVGIAAIRKAGREEGEEKGVGGGDRSEGIMPTFWHLIPHF